MSGSIAEIELAHRRYIDMRIEEIDKRYEARFTMNQRALDVALEASNSKLEGINEWRLSYSDMVGRATSRNEIDSLIRESVSHFEGEVNPLKIKVEQIGKTNWPLMASFATIIFSMLAGVWLIIGLKIDAVNSPSLVAIELIRAATAQIDVRLARLEPIVSGLIESSGNSKADRGQLGDRMRQVEALAGNTQAELVARGRTNASRQTEFEAELKSLADSVNNANEADQQMTSIIYETVFPGKRYPFRNYRPSILSARGGG